MLSLLTESNDVVYGLSKTTLSGNGTLATPGTGVGNYYDGEIPRYALDQNINTKYTNFGDCYRNGFNQDCGTDTGFYVTPQQGATLLLAIQFTTANNIPERDPLSIIIEGSNATSSALMLGASWSLIFSISTGLEIDPGRKTDGPLVCLPKNVVWYTSYRILVTSIRDSNDAVQYSEVKLFGYANPNRTQNSSVSTS